MEQSSLFFDPVNLPNPEAAAKAETAGLRVVQNACMRATHRMLFG